MLDPTEFGKSMAAIVRDAQAPLNERIKVLEAALADKPEPVDVPALVEQSVRKYFEANPPKDGLNGSSITVSDVAPLIAESVKAAVDALPKPKDGEKGKDADEIDMDAIKSMIALAVEIAIPPPVPGPIGLKGDKGDDADPIDVKEVVAELLAGDEIKTLVELHVAEGVQKHFDVNPIKHGVDGNNGNDATDAQVEKAVSAYLKSNPPLNGEKGADGVGLAGAMIDREGCLIVTTTKGDPIKLGIVVGKDGDRGKDGADFTDCTVDYDGERGLIIRSKSGEIVKKLPIPMDKGYWREGMPCEKADILTHNGNAWIALRDTKAKPCLENKDDWRIFARKGRDGTDRMNGRDLGPAEPVKLNGAS